MSKVRLRMAVLISGGGRTMLNLHEHIVRGSLPAVIEVVVSSRPDAAGIEKARAAGIPVVVVQGTSLNDEGFHRRITDVVDGADLVCMAGFLSLWHIPDALIGKVINIHPALLPDFGGAGMYGRRVHEAVLAAGRKESGCTVHFCDNEYDHGPVILQRRVRVFPDDTAAILGARVFEQECIAYPEAVQLFCQDRVRLRGNQVEIGP